MVEDLVSSWAFFCAYLFLSAKAAEFPTPIFRAQAALGLYYAGSREADDLRLSEECFAWSVGRWPVGLSPLAGLEITGT